MKTCTNITQLTMGDLIDFDCRTGVYAGIATQNEVVVTHVEMLEDVYTMGVRIRVYFRVNGSVSYWQFARQSWTKFDNIRSNLNKESFMMLRLLADEVFYVPFSYIEQLNNQGLSILEKFDTCEVLA